jgi:OOP family OmpA-OmpF porin
VEFQTGSARLAETATALIEAMASKLRELPADQTLLIRGHTDNRGARSANLLLSRRRAEAVLKALVAAGIPAERLKSEGRGPDEPVAPNTSDQGRAQNRRVEFKLVRAK